MLKFPPVPSRNKTMSYTNGCISEYLACHILTSLGLKTQETLLGTYTDPRGKEKVVVACEDFTENGKKLIEFAHLKNTCISSEQNGYGTELSSILQAMDEQTLLPPDQLQEFFWDMEAILNNEDEIDRRVYVFPTSSVEEDGKKISYFEFISSLKSPDCMAALKRISARIDMEKICTLIEEAPTLLPIDISILFTIYTVEKPVQS